jgi:hypothetical protein
VEYLTSSALGNSLACTCACGKRAAG